MSRILSEPDGFNPEPRPSFFSTQFSVDTTSGQRIFDVFFGIAAPILCFFADPIVFKVGFAIGGQPVLGRYQVFAYLLSAIVIAVLVIWLLLEEHLEAYSSLIGGVFVAGALFSLLVGLIILPFSLLGLVFVIGLPGFTPFLTAFVYLRNGVKVFRRSKHTRVRLKTAGALLAVSISIGLPALVSYQLDLMVSQSVDVLLNGDALHAEAAVDRLRWLPVVPESSLDSLVFAYRREQDGERKQTLKRYYYEATGRDIDWRLRLMDD